MRNDSLGDRMKSYEGVYSTKLPNRLPVIIRVDGRAFHTLTKKLGLIKPFDACFIDIMNETAKYLCENISGAQMAYVQSDEISILIKNYTNLNTQPWFDNKIQKMVSLSASLATAKFNELIKIRYLNYSGNLPTFDSRVFILPTSDVCNYFIWRQQDCTRNSIQVLARSMYSHKECDNKNTSQLQEMTFVKGCNWNDLTVAEKRGRCIIKFDYPSGWNNSLNIPRFTEDRNFIERFI